MVVKLSELISQLQSIHREIGSHPSLDDSLSIFVQRDDDLEEMEIVEIDAKQVMGCGCFYGADIILRSKTTDNIVIAKT
jgi:hypothetical protein